MDPIAPCPAYARALRWRIYALSLWLGRMALMPFGLTRSVEPLLLVPVAVGVVGGFMGPVALWPVDRRAALAELAACAVALLPLLGWMYVSYGPPPSTESDVPWSAAPEWTALAAAAWLCALAFAGRRLRALHITAWLPAALLLVADQPPLHRPIFTASPRVAELLAPFATVAALFALTRMEKRLRGPR